MRGRIAAETPLRLPQECKNRGCKLLSPRAEVNTSIVLQIIVTKCVECRPAEAFEMCWSLVSSNKITTALSHQRITILWRTKTASRNKSRRALSLSARLCTSRFSFDGITRYGLAKCEAGFLTEKNNRSSSALHAALDRQLWTREQTAGEE